MTFDPEAARKEQQDRLAWRGVVWVPKGKPGGAVSELWVEAEAQLTAAMAEIERLRSLFDAGETTMIFATTTLHSLRAERDEQLAANSVLVGERDAARGLADKLGKVAIGCTSFMWACNCQRCSARRSYEARDWK